MLAMVANDNAGNLTPRGVPGFIASELAPTGVESVLTQGSVIQTALVSSR